MRGIDINSVIAPDVVKAATDGCLIAYHRKSDGFQMAVPYSSWPALEKQGEVADGVLVLIDGQAPIIVSPTGTQLYWSKNAVAIDASVGIDYAKAYVDFTGKTRTATILNKSIELFGSVEDAKNYAPGWCRDYSHGGLGAGKWWLPSIAEMIEIWKHKYAINVCLSVISGASQLVESWHWSSTDGAAAYAWLLGLSNGYLTWANKVSDSLYVRAVSAFHGGTTESMLYFPQDNNTYGLRNGIPEIIAGDGEEVLVTDAATAQSLALQSLEQGVLVLDGADDKMTLEIREILGEELFNELAAKSVKTMELQPEPSFEERLAQAKEDFYLRKVNEARMAEEVMRQMSEAEEVEATDVDASELPKIGKKDVESDKTE
ncbi:MAG: DUF1566 domain-containing protein [Muribaculaceae bacterium]|nr:DUF1566 domain-containing protein [Muribaculaceae bacterium]